MNTATYMNTATATATHIEIICEYMGKVNEIDDYFDCINILREWVNNSPFPDSDLVFHETHGGVCCRNFNVDYNTCLKNYEFLKNSQLLRSLSIKYSIVISKPSNEYIKHEFRKGFIDKI